MQLSSHVVLPPILYAHLVWWTSPNFHHRYLLRSCSIDLLGPTRQPQIDQINRLNTLDAFVVSMKMLEPYPSSSVKAARISSTSAVYLANEQKKEALNCPESMCVLTVQDKYDPHRQTLLPEHLLKIIPWEPVLLDTKVACLWNKYCWRSFPQEQATDHLFQKRHYHNSVCANHNHHHLHVSRTMFHYVLKQSLILFAQFATHTPFGIS